MPQKYKRHIYDEVYGSIGITNLENELIDSKIFQRLRRISHLGMASYVYPGAVHSRFSHSIGAMHIISTISESMGLNEDEIELLRITALLHDVGHLPFSHVLEGKEDSNDHKDLGIQIIEQSSLSTILKKHKVKPEKIINILNKASDARYSQLIDSDVDVDKIDYLTRDTHHTGLIYGNIDIDRLIRTLYFDENDRLCVKFKGRQALENFLLARYYMFTTLYQHRTVYAFELMMRLIYDRFRRKRRKTERILLPSEIAKNADNWSNFDDTYLWYRINHPPPRHDRILENLIKMIRIREPLKLVCEEQRMIEESGSDRYYNLLLLYSKPEQRKLLAQKSGVPLNWIFVERLKPIHLTSQSEDAAIRIEKEEGGETIPIREDKSSIISFLGNMERDSIRVYTLEKHKEKLRDRISQMYFL